MSRIRYTVLAAVLFSALHVSETRATDGPYLGGGIGVATVKDNVDTGGTFDADDASYRVFAGWRFDLIPVIDVAVEVAYTDFGKPSQSVMPPTATQQNVQVKLRGPSAAGLLILPLGPFDLYGKAGIQEWQLEQTVSGSTTKRSGSDPFYGIGASFYVWKLGFRAEYERFQIKDVDRVQMISVQALFQF